MRGHWFLLPLIAACNQSDFGAPDFGDDPPPGPGSPTWTQTDLSCQATSDCAPGETCDGGFCRPKQCDDGPYDSAAPLGPDHMLYRDHELLVIDATASQGAYWVDGYGASGAIDYHGPGGGSFSMGGGALTDVGRIVTKQGPGMVVAAAGSSNVTVTGGVIAKQTINVGLVPVAVGAGDVDGDQQDEIIALAANGHVAVCAQGGSCTQWSFSNITGVDVAVADTDGDGVDEVIMLVSTGGKTETLAWKVRENTTVGALFDTHFQAVTAGDFDRDGRAEVALLEDRGWLGFASDKVHMYRVGAQWQGVAATATTGSAIDLAAGDPDGTDAGDVVAVLGSNQDVDVMRWNGSALAKVASGSVATTSSPARIALGDTDGDSVAMRLVSGPDLVSNGLTPMMVVTFPPYDANVSKGATSGVGVGNRTNTSEDATTTVTLSAGVEVGVGADFLSIFSARLSQRLAVDVSKSQTVSKQLSVGTRFSLKPQVDLYGDRYGAVVVGCSCFHSYVYELVDPSNHAGGSGHRLTMVVPVGGQTTVLSTPRYNALAKHAGKLPEIQVASQIGEPKSYPSSPTKLDGSPVQPDEHVFPHRPVLTVSDVGTVSFSLGVGTSETNSQSLTTTVGVSGSLGALGVTFGASLGASWGRSLAVTIGSGTDFSGDVPPIGDDPSTPEDEYQTHGFTYSPYVYRQPYTLPGAQQPSGFYVLDYAVGAR
jgi:hypothetical protein